jgi:hypothetical protein
MADASKPTFPERFNIADYFLDDRIRALEPQPAVDPLYTEIERDITDKLGGQVSPELLCTIINEAYAERKK